MENQAPPVEKNLKILAASMIRHTTGYELLPSPFGMAGTWQEAISKVLSSLLFLELIMSH